MVNKMPIWACLLCVLLAACDNPESQFASAQKTGTIEAFKAFIQAYPEHALAAQAKATLGRLEWEVIKDSNDRQVVLDYIARYPDSEFKQNADGRLEKIDYDAAVKSASVSALQAYLKQYPNSNYQAEVLEAILKIGEAGESGGLFSVQISIGAKSGLLRMGRNGSIASYPENTVVNIEISDEDAGLKYEAVGKYVSMIDAFALFEVGKGDFYISLPSGFLAPCFCGTAEQPNDMTAEQKMYQRWRLSRLQSMIGFVYANEGSDDADTLSVLGALQIPHAKRALNRLSAKGSEETRKLAQSSLKVWQTIQQKTCL